MVRGINEQSFDKITQEFLTAAKREQLPEDLAAAVVELHRGPMSGTDAVVTWRRWLEAPPDDPIGDLTLRDMRDLFQRSVQDLGRSRKAADDFLKRVTEPSTLPKFAENARKANWQAFRAYISEEVRKGSSAPESLLCTLDTPLHLAHLGLVQDLLVESYRRSSDAISEQTALLEELSRRGLAGMMRTIATGASVKGLWGAIAWHVGGTAVAAGVAIAGGVAGSAFVAGGCGLAAATYCGYCLSRYRPYWD